MLKSRNRRIKRRLNKKEFLKNVVYNTLKHHIFLFFYFNRVFTKECFEWKKYKCRHMSEFIVFPYLMQNENNKPEVKQIFTWLKAIKDIIYEEKIYGLIFNLYNKKLKTDGIISQLAISINKTNSINNLGLCKDIYFQTENEYISCEKKTFLRLINHITSAAKKYKKNLKKKKNASITEGRSISMKIFCKDTSSLLANKLFAKTKMLASIKQWNQNNQMLKNNYEYRLNISSFNSLHLVNSKKLLARTKKLTQYHSDRNFKLLSNTEKASKNQFSLIFEIENPEDTKILIDSQKTTKLDTKNNFFSEIEGSESEHLSSLD